MRDVVHKLQICVCRVVICSACCCSCVQIVNKFGVHLLCAFNIDSSSSVVSRIRDAAQCAAEIFKIYEYFRCVFFLRFSSQRFFTNKRQAQTPTQHPSITRTFKLEFRFMCISRCSFLCFFFAHRLIPCRGHRANRENSTLRRLLTRLRIYIRLSMRRTLSIARARVHCEPKKNCMNK